MTAIAVVRHLLVSGALCGALLGLAAPGLAQTAKPPARFVLHDSPKPVADIAFEDKDGRKLTLAQFRGRVVLLNVWATWCGPCRKEMPTLDRLQAALGGADFAVVALSIDRAGMPAVETFYFETGVEHLAPYIDRTARASRSLGVVGLPTTLLLDRDGREVGRLVGAAEWDSPDMVAFLRSFVDGAHATETTNGAKS